MKKILSLSIVAVMALVQPVMAQDAKAKGILEAVSKKVNSLKSLKANFALHLTGNGGKVKETKKGTFYMKGTKYRVEIAGQEIMCDNKTVWTYMKATNEVQVSNYNPSEQTISPTKLFTNFYDKEYNYKYVGKRKVGTKTCEIIEMTPIAKGKQLSKVELAVDNTNTIVGGNVWEKNGNMYKYEVSGFTPNAAVNDGMFSFDTKKYPGVEVVDLR